VLTSLAAQTEAGRHGGQGVTQTGLELFDDLQKAFATGDQEALGRVLHPDFEIEQPASLPHGGRHRGLAGMAAMGRAFAEHWDRTIDAPVVRDAGDVVIQVTTQRWTAKATGRSATVDVVELVSFADERIREIRVFQQDTHALLATLDPRPDRS
jgi:uncharacterized protein